MKFALKLPVFALTLATLSAGAYAQASDNSAAGSAPNTQTQPAPITRNPAGRIMPKINTLQPTPGVLVRSDASSSVNTVATGENTELRVERGRATIEINHPKGNSQITVDLPGGQVDLLKDGLYTFNAETNTVRVLRGEASAYAGSATSGKAVKVKEDHELSFTTAGKLRSVDADPRELTADLVPGPGAGPGGARGYAGGGGYGPAYGPGPYGDGFVEYPYAPYPYFAYGYPYWGYPYYGWGYPFGFGVGFGFYGGGFYRGGFRR